MRCILVLTLICFTIGLKAQENADNEAFQQLIGRSYTDISLTHKNIFFRSSYLPGKLTFKSGDSIEGLFIRYSCYEDEVLWLNKDYGQIKLDKARIQNFEIRNADTVFFFNKYKLKSYKDSTEHFYQEYINRRIKLLALRKLERVSTYFKEKKYDVYAPRPEFILIINNKEYLIRKLKIKNVLQLFPDKKEEINKQLNANPIHIKKEQDFIKFILSIENILSN